MLRAWCLAVFGVAFAVAMLPARAPAQTKAHYVLGKPYQFDGVWYEPAVDYGYDQTGIASIYPPDYAGLSTTSGEPYDANVIAGAHKTLPLPCVVRVTNLDNGKSIKLRLNDRGPFVDNRIVELTPAAAQALGVTNQTGVQVRVQIIAKESEALAAALQRAGGAGSSVAAVPAPVVKVTSLPLANSTAVQPMKPVSAPGATPPLPPQPTSPPAETTPPVTTSAVTTPVSATSASTAPASTTPAITPAPASSPAAAATAPAISLAIPLPESAPATPPAPPSNSAADTAQVHVVVPSAAPAAAPAAASAPAVIPAPAPASAAAEPTPVVIPSPTPEPAASPAAAAAPAPVLTFNPAPAPATPAPATTAPAQAAPAVSASVTNATVPAAPAISASAEAIPVQLSSAPAAPEPTKIKPLPVDLPAQFFIQTGAFKKTTDANTLRNKLTALGPAKVVPTRLGADEFNAVLLGPIPTMNDAQRLLKQITGMGYSDAVLIIE